MKNVQKDSWKYVSKPSLVLTIVVVALSKKERRNAMAFSWKVTRITIA